jgi:hypothetical protein
MSGEGLITSIHKKLLAFEKQITEAQVAIDACPHNMRTSYLLGKLPDSQKQVAIVRKCLDNFENSTEADEAFTNLQILNMSITVADLVLQDLTSLVSLLPTP